MDQTMAYYYWTDQVGQKITTNAPLSKSFHEIRPEMN